MKNKTIKELIGLVNDPEYKDEAFEEIEQRIKGVIKGVIKRYKIRGYDYDDLYNEALLVVYNQLPIYDGSIEFGIVVRTWCRNYLSDLYDYHNAAKRKHNAIRLDCNNKEEDENSLYNCLAVYDDLEDQDEIAYLLNLLKPSLSKREKNVFNLHLLSYGRDEIASKLGLNCKQVDNALTRISIKARAIYKEYLDNNL